MATKKEVTKTENETTMAEVKKITKASNKVTKEEKVDVPAEPITETINDVKTEQVSVTPVKEQPNVEEQTVDVKKEEPKVEEKPVEVKKEEPKQEKKEEIKKPLGRPVTKYWGGINDGWY